MDGLIAVTYRCNAHCVMCNTWCHPSRPADEITAADLRSLPSLEFANVTGGEPFMRDDLADLVSVLVGKAKRVVVSTNGYYTDRVLALAQRFPHIGVRVSLEGLPAANDQLRGLPDGFDHGLRTILRLRALGLRDIGFGITLSDRNADDLMELYELADAMGVEFATAAIHNSYYFHKFDNAFDDPDYVAGKIEDVARRLLQTRRPKSWFRAWFNMGLANYVQGWRPSAAVRRRRGPVLRRSVRRGAALQRDGRDDGLAQAALVRRDLGKPRGAPRAQSRDLVHAQLLDDRLGLAGHEEEHPGAGRVGAARQALPVGAARLPAGRGPAARPPPARLPRLPGDPGSAA